MIIKDKQDFEKANHEAAKARQLEDYLLESAREKESYFMSEEDFVSKYLDN